MLRSWAMRDEITELRKELGYRVDTVMVRVESFRNGGTMEVDALALARARGGIRLDEGVEQFAVKQGLFLLASSGDAVRVVNPTSFKPRVWRHSRP